MVEGASCSKSVAASGTTDTLQKSRGSNIGGLTKIFSAWLQTTS